MAAQDVDIDTYLYEKREYPPSGAAAAPTSDSGCVMSYFLFDSV